MSAASCLSEISYPNETLDIRTVHVLLAGSQIVITFFRIILKYERENYYFYYIEKSVNLYISSRERKGKNYVRQRITTKEYVYGVQDEVSVEKIFHRPATQYSQVPVLNT